MSARGDLGLAVGDASSPFLRQPPTTHAASADPDLTVAETLGRLDHDRMRADFQRQGAFIHLEEFLPPEVTSQLASNALALQGEVNRTYLPGHKQGGSVSRHTIDRLAPPIAQLYRSRALIALLEQICGERLLACPPDDAHAYALYYYTRPGDYIGWHYDTSYYDGRRYTVLLGVIDNDSSCRLDYQLHTRETDRPSESGSLQMAPGGLVFFDGDKLRHRITPLGAHQKRVSLTFEYVTDAGMRPWWRFISNMKDAVAYFGFRQSMRGRRGDV